VLALIEEWAAAKKPCPFHLFEAWKGRPRPKARARRLATAIKPPGAPAPRDNLTREERKRAHAQQMARARPQREAPRDPGQAPDLTHLSLKVADLIVRRRADPAAVQSVLVHGFYRPGEQNPPSRWGTPMDEEALWIRCRPHYRDGLPLPPETFADALEWLVGKNVLAVVHETRRYVLLLHGTSPTAVVIAERLHALIAP
jgi:hypothetical protein